MKRIQLGTRLVICLLSLVLMLSVFAACQTQGGNTTTTEGSNSATTGSQETGTTGLQEDALPDDLNFDRLVKVLGCEQQNYHYYALEKNEEMINNVLYDRNATVEDRLGIEIEWIFEPGTFNERTTFIAKVESTNKSGDPYDAVISYNLLPYAMAMKGLCENLYEQGYIDLTAPWWPSAYIETGVFENQIFGLVESCSYGTLERMIATFFNQDLLANKGLDNPYNLVAANEWTFDKLMSMVKDTYEDFNSDSKVDKGDFFGLCAGGTSPMLDGWYFSLGNRYSEINGDGDLVLLLGQPAVGEFLDRVKAAFYTQDVCLYDASHTKMFTEERAIFYTTIVGMTAALKETEVEYGVVPVPKSSSEQKDYYTHLGNTHEAWSIPKNVKDLNCSTALLECMASEAYRQVNPVYFESMLKLRYAQDERIADMYDLVRESIGFDFCYLYSVAFTTATRPNALINGCLTSESKSWSSTWETNQNAVESQFQTIINAYFAN